MSKRPNIVVILADDWGYGDVSCLNPDSRIPTPNTDRAAQDGMVFTDAHSNSAVCTPTRYGILTGRYCWRGRLKSGVLWGYSPPLIEDGRITMASMLRERGYATACIGKWHLGLGWQKKEGAPADGSEPSAETTDFTKPLLAGPHTVGFDYSCILPASLDMDPYCYIENGQIIEQPTRSIADSARPAFWRGGPCAPGFQHETCLLEFTTRAEQYIQQQTSHHADQPYFLYFPTPSPHTPHFQREPFRGASRAGVYGDYVVEHDWSVGRILAAIDRSGQRDNTLVIITSDNGCHCEPIRLWEDYGHKGNYIYRGQKSDAWDGGHRIPFIVRWPDRVAAGLSCSQAICLTDLMATSAAMNDVQLPADAGEDSVNILPYLKGEQVVRLREGVVHHSLDGKFALRKGSWKLVECKGSGGWTLPEEKVQVDAPPLQLYNMDNDPEEQHNLYREHPELVKELQAILDRYRSNPRST
jgi:arylsulfatase A-like enzyme